MIPSCSYFMKPTTMPMSSYLEGMHWDQVKLVGKKDFFGTFYSV